MTTRDHNNEQLPLLMRERQAMERYAIGRNTLRKMGFESGAIIKIGRCLRYRRDVLDECIETLSASGNSK